MMSSDSKRIISSFKFCPHTSYLSSSVKISNWGDGKNIAVLSPVFVCNFDDKEMYIFESSEPSANANNLNLHVCFHLACVFMPIESGQTHGYDGLKEWPSMGTIYFGEFIYQPSKLLRYEG